MNRFPLLLTALLFFTNVYSQKVSFSDKLVSSKYISNGTELYNLGRTYDALMIFKQARVRNPNNWKAHFWVSTAEFDLNNYNSALESGNKALELTKEKEDADLNMLLAKINHKLGNIEQAVAHYKTATNALGAKAAKEYDLPIYIAQCEFALNEKREGVVNKRKLLAPNLNSKYEEYGPILTNDGKHLFFTARNSETTGGGMNPDDQRFFEDMYHAKYNEKTKEFELQVETFEGINTEGFDALNSVSWDGTYCLGTLNTSASKEKSTASSEIFELSTDVVADYGSPTVIVNTTINTTYFEGAASITDTLWIGEEQENYQQIMVFVSDRNGEKSLTDIFSVEKKNGVWGSAKLLPKHINTPGRETTPFISQDGKYLFFSSDALPGMGGYDIYYCENVNGEWSKPINLGGAINTPDDDTHFQYYPKLKKAVLAGIRENEGVFNYDLFEVNMEGMDFPFMK